MQNFCMYCKAEGFDVSFSRPDVMAEHVESEHSNHAAGIDPLISDYAAKLQGIYDKRTAGDFTFTGVLSEFARAVVAAEHASVDYPADTARGPGDPDW